LRPPLKSARDGGGFDLVYSIGVLHHLENPAAGIESLACLVRPGGTLALWVYGHENNGLVRTLVEPLRGATTHMPVEIVRVIAWPLAIVFHSVAKAVYATLAARHLDRRLPLNEYMTAVSRFSFRQNYGIVFDQLAAPHTHYVRKSELREWLTGLGLVDVAITSRQRNSWRAQARVAD
jgi:SAM-dependent methyltransferase